MTWSAAYLLASLVLAVWLVRRWTRLHASCERASRPRELANAELVYMEKLFRIGEPIRLVARVDRAYRLPGGSLVLVELKTRKMSRPYLSDVIQLSAQRLAIEMLTGEVVEPYGYVSVLGGNRKMRSHQVRLLDAEAVVDLYRRREAIRTGRAPPAYASAESACRGCALRSRCDRFGR
jgi:CRISPR/Cas system-associated exonuclease Cas4 (RecB family)